MVPSFNLNSFPSGVPRLQPSQSCAKSAIIARASLLKLYIQILCKNLRVLHDFYIIFILRLREEGTCIMAAPLPEVAVSERRLEPHEVPGNGNFRMQEALEGSVETKEREPCHLH